MSTIPNPLARYADETTGDSATVKEELMLLGYLIAKRRTEEQLTQAEVGRRAKIQRTHLSRIERGLCNLRLSTLLSITDALETTLGELLSSAELAVESPTQATAPPSAARQQLDAEGANYP